MLIRQDTVRTSAKKVWWWHLSKDTIADVVLHGSNLHLQGKQFETMIPGKRWELEQKCNKNTDRFLYFPTNCAEANAVHRNVDIYFQNTFSIRPCNLNVQVIWIIFYWRSNRIAFYKIKINKLLCMRVEIKRK